MTVNPVISNSITSGYSKINFQGRRKHVNCNDNAEACRMSNPRLAVPLATLIAMSPLEASAIDVDYLDINENKIEMPVMVDDLDVNDRDYYLLVDDDLQNSQKSNSTAVKSYDVPSQFKSYFRGYDSARMEMYDIDGDSEPDKAVFILTKKLGGNGRVQISKLDVSKGFLITRYHLKDFNYAICADDVVYSLGDKETIIREPGKEDRTMLHKGKSRMENDLFKIINATYKKLTGEGVSYTGEIVHISNDDYIRKFGTGYTTDKLNEFREKDKISKEKTEARERARRNESM